MLGRQVPCMCRQFWARLFSELGLFVEAVSPKTVSSYPWISRETGISGNFVGRIQGAKGPFDLQFLTWDVF